MQVAFSLQTDGSGLRVLTKGKRPKRQLSPATCQLTKGSFTLQRKSGLDILKKVVWTNFSLSR